MTICQKSHNKAYIDSLCMVRIFMIQTFATFELLSNEKETNYSLLPISGIGEEVKFAKLAKVAILKCLKNKNEIIASKQYQGDLFEDLMKAYGNACAHYAYLDNIV